MKDIPWMFDPVPPLPKDEVYYFRVDGSPKSSHFFKTLAERLKKENLRILIIDCEMDTSHFWRKE